MLRRRIFLALLAAPLALAVPGAARADSADSYPNRSIRMIVPYPPGGGGDAVARIIAPKLQEALGQTVVIDNRPGAGASIGTDMAAKSPPDGYTILETPGAALTVNPQLMQVGYDPQKDLMPVAMLTRAVMLFAINPKVPAQNIQEFIAYAKANPGKLNYGSAGNGTITQLSWEMLKLSTGIDVVHVPYKGSGPAINDVLGGRVQGMVESVLLPYVRAGQMRPLAIGGDKRWKDLPDVPTLKELGINGVEPSAWYGVFVPAGTPPAIVEKLSATLLKIAVDPSLADKFDGAGMVPTPEGPEEFAKTIRADIKTNGEVIRKAHITLE
jgi:tripartite-type tricarboxylate transporter receptor subunit TctC